MTLIQCPECQQEISDRSDACPQCGFSLARVAREEAKKEEGRSCAMALLALMLPPFLMIFVACFGMRERPLPSEQWEPSMSQKLAAIEVNSASGASDSALSSGMQRRLERLARKFPETEERIGNMTVTSKQILDEKGVSKSLIEIMDEIDYMVPNGELGVTYAESAALYVTAQSR